MTDVEAASLANPDTRLRVLATLILDHTQVTDMGAAAVAAKGTGLKDLN